MSLRRISVQVEESDLALIEEAARRRGVSGAELIREAVHRTAMAHRVWEEPFFSRTFRRPVLESVGRDPQSAATDAAVCETDGTTS